MKVRLNTEGGLVGYFQMVAFQPPPDVTIWGDRVFKIRTNGGRIVEPPPQDDCDYIYDECFAVAIVSERTNS